MLATGKKCAVVVVANKISVSKIAQSIAG